MIQLYAKTADLVPTEPLNRDFGDHTMQDRVNMYNDSIKAGFTHGKRVNPDGTLSKGNATWYICYKNNIDYIPIDISWFLGYYAIQDSIGLRSDLLTMLPPQNQLTSPITKPTIKKYRFETNPPLLIPSYDMFDYKGVNKVPNINGQPYIEKQQLCKRCKDEI